MTAKQILLVSNPSSGGSDDERVSIVEGELRASGDVRKLQPEGDGADDEVRSAAGSAGLVVVAGGDGTLHRIVNALEASIDDFVFAVIPMGTGNDWARTLGVPEDPAARRVSRPAAPFAPWISAGRVEPEVSRGSSSTLASGAFPWR